MTDLDSGGRGFSRHVLGNGVGCRINRDNWYRVKRRKRRRIVNDSCGWSWPKASRRFIADVRHITSVHVTAVSPAPIPARERRRCNWRSKSTHDRTTIVFKPKVHVWERVDDATCLKKRQVGPRNHSELIASQRLARISISSSA